MGTIKQGILGGFSGKVRRSRRSAAAGGRKAAGRPDDRRNAAARRARTVRADAAGGQGLCQAVAGPVL